jgi:hypothetical protein
MKNSWMSGTVGTEWFSDKLHCTLQTYCIVKNTDCKTLCWIMLLGNFENSSTAHHRHSWSLGQRVWILFGVQENFYFPILWHYATGQLVFNILNNHRVFIFRVKQSKKTFSAALPWEPKILQYETCFLILSMRFVALSSGKFWFSGLVQWKCTVPHCIPYC